MNTNSITSAIQFTIGFIGYWVKPSSTNVWGGAFNGQQFRRQIFLDVLHNLNFSTVVETGTFRGDTTSFFMRNVKKVFSVEYDFKNFGVTKARFLFHRNVRLFRNDSRAFLRELSDSNENLGHHPFFYLDAHWGEDLPLAEELDTICARWPDAIVMIDDFCVPDSEYRYDDYGPGKALNIDYLHNNVSSRIDALFFPVENASKETGSRRGSVVLSFMETSTQRLLNVSSIKKHKLAGV